MPPGDENIAGMTIDEMESQLATAAPETPAATAPDPAIAAMENALRISEEARKEAMKMVETARAPSAPAAPTAPAPNPLETLTDEDLAKLIEEKGAVAALRIVQAQTLQIMQQHADTRFSGLASAGATAAEQTARTKYALEFELFGDDIAKVVNDAPDKTALNNPATWDNMIAWIRGKEGNIQKYAGKLAEKSSAIAAAEAIAGQRGSAGAVIAPTSSTIAAGAGVTAGADGHYGLDATEREIADNLGRSYKDYATWKKVGG